MTENSAIENEILDIVPNLRAFARSLTHRHDVADDLVQETLLKSLKNIDKFERGTNLRAWLFTILRNTFYSNLRKKSREVEDADGNIAAQLVSREEQTGRLEMRDFHRAFVQLPAAQREALILVGASGFSYEEAASICECAVGTIKSRVNRARQTLTEMLDPGDDEVSANAADSHKSKLAAGA
jgi:RNA polymerase sigma-70 factor (ECF subfamily)